MSKNPKKTEYDIKYAKEHLKRVPLDLKVEKYNQVKAFVESQGKSLNGFIKEAIDEKIERDTSEKE